MNSDAVVFGNDRIPEHKLTAAVIFCTRPGQKKADQGGF